MGLLRKVFAMTTLQANGYYDPKLVEFVLDNMEEVYRPDKIKEMIKFHKKKMNEPNISAEQRATHEQRMAAWIAARMAY